MKRIKLSKGQYALIDDEDFDFLNQWKWSLMCDEYGLCYAYRKEPSRYNGRSVYMHREILNLKNKSLLIDHINHNGLDNQKQNLRLCNEKTNHLNRKKCLNTSSKYKGVYFHKASLKWLAQIQKYGKHEYLGMFESQEKAALAYNQRARQLFGEFAYLNFLGNKN